MPNPNEKAMIKRPITRFRITRLMKIFVGSKGLGFNEDIDSFFYFQTKNPLRDSFF